VIAATKTTGKDSERPKKAGGMLPRHLRQKNVVLELTESAPRETCISLCYLSGFALSKRVSTYSRTSALTVDFERLDMVRKQQGSAILTPQQRPSNGRKSGAFLAIPELEQETHI
jgi:hypothetical protein